LKPGSGATRIVASTVGAYAGLLGVEHGFFEALQGNGATGGLLINAIGPGAGVAGSEPALTIIPDYMATGIAAIAVSFLVMVWAAAFVQRKSGGLILILLSLIQLLVGGGLAPLFLAIPAAAVATRINKPLAWWRARLPVNSLPFLTKMWPWPLIAFFLLSAVDLGIAISGNSPGLIDILPPCIFGLLFLAIITGFAYDLGRQADPHKAPSMSGPRAVL
jgi:hypothetical protein